jgi:tetratricopeptide (TPR) repeat protein
LFLNPVSIAAMPKSMLNRATGILRALILLAPCFGVVAWAQTAAVPPPTADTAATQGASLIQMAIASIAAKDLDGAKTQLDKAQALSPDQKLYWATSGNLLLKRGQKTEALAAFRKELALYPGETVMYRSIVDTQFSLQQRKDAMTTLHDWSVAAPTDALPPSKLMALLVEDGDSAAAVKEGKDVLLRLPEEGRKDDRFQIELGRAEILSGDKPGGIALIHAVLARTDDPAMADNAAYVLADSGADLATAEKVTRNHINTLAAASSTWALGTDVRSMRNWSSILDSTWDTLGWTLFREGKLEEARSYLSAAWQGLLSRDVGEHLAEVEEALGNKAGALQAYELSLAVVQPDDNLGERKALAIKPTEVQVRIQTLRKAGADSTVADPASELLRLRTITLSPSLGQNRRVTYIILLRDGKLVDVQPLSARALQGVPEMFAKTDLTRYFPAGSHGSLVRTGQLACQSGNCQMVLGLAEQQ